MIRSTGKQEMANRFSLLLSPGFVGGLGLLLLNDFLLKPTFHNWLTGKLSDFAGLFIFPLFFVALCPRFKRPIYLATAALFLLWKSAYTRPLIDWWNYYTPIQVGRVEDLTDALALLALPLSYLYESRVPHIEPKRLATCFICLLSIFAFTATSFPRTEQGYGKEYYFPIGQAALTDRIEKLSKIMVGGVTDPEAVRRKEKHRTVPSIYKIQFHFGGWTPETALVVVSGDKERAKISLMQIRGEGRPRQEEWLSYFEKEFIEPLKQDPVSVSSKIHSIWLIG
jgi:hypothetical protein